MQITFCFDKGECVAVLDTDEEEVYYKGTRTEVFEIAEAERLIGCKLDVKSGDDGDYFCGVTWLKMQVKF